MAGLVVLGATTALFPPLRAATWDALPLSSYQQVTTYRVGPWIAAVDMAAERPLSGYGPGTFAAEMQTHQFAAEIRLHERLGQPTGASFVRAHQDYLQLAAEAGIPALLLFLGATAKSPTFSVKHDFSEQFAGGTLRNELSVQLPGRDRRTR